MEQNKWRDTLCTWIRKLNIAKKSVPLKLINAILIKIQVYFYIEVEKLMLKFIWKSKEPGRAKQFWKTNKQTNKEWVTLHRLKTYYEVILIKTVWLRYENRQIDP